MAKCWIISTTYDFCPRVWLQFRLPMPWKIRIAFCHSRAFSQALIAAPKLTMSGWRSASDLGLLAISYPTLGWVTTCDYCQKCKVKLDYSSHKRIYRVTFYTSHSTSTSTHWNLTITKQVTGYDMVVHVPAVPHIYIYIMSWYKLVVAPRTHKYKSTIYNQ